MSLSPIEKPTADELRTAKIVHQSVKDGARVVRYRIPSPTPRDKIEHGHCVLMDRVFEVHIPADGNVATWWRVFGA